MNRKPYKRYLMAIALVLAFANCHAQAPTKYGKYDISKLTPSVEYCGLEIRENSITLEVWNNHTNIDLSFSGDAKKDITTLIYENYEAKMPGIIDLFVKEKTVGETSSTVLRIGRGFLDDLIRKYNVWKAKEDSKKAAIKQKQAQQKKAQLQAEQLLYAALVARILNNMLSPSTSSNQYYYNGLNFRSEADMEDYKNANGLK
jgi:hypothetical protein